MAANIYGTAAIAADFDNDGFVDLLVTGYGRAILYRNNGDGTFEDVTAKAGIKVDGWSISSAWLDYDRDGCVDLFVGRYVKFDPKYRNFYPADNYPGPLDYAADTNRLYHNNCNGTFTDVTDKSGIGAFKGRTMGVTAADFDGDGYPDIYVANDKTENFLFHNKHDGTFEEVAGDLGRGLRTERREHFRHGAGLRRRRWRRPARSLGDRLEVQPPDAQRRRERIRRYRT